VGAFPRIRGGDSIASMICYSFQHFSPHMRG